jgi:hydroxymethylglutaryl-CoA reductase
VSRRVTSRLGGFYRQGVADRLLALAEAGSLDGDTVLFLTQGGGLGVTVADRMSENVVACHGLPLGIGLNFTVNQHDYLVPMAVEEPSVIAAASNAARMVRASGGFVGEADASVMTAQIQLDEVPAPHDAAALLREHRVRLLARGDESIPRLLARGGGCRDLEVRVLDEEHGVLVCDLFIDVGDAMGANVVDTVAEAVAPVVQGLIGGRMGLRILSNLPVRRMVRVEARVSDEALGGAEVSEGIERASRFAGLDPLRAVTHNKGFMNGLDAAAVALGQDWRSIEAAAHAYASIQGKYSPLSTWRRVEGGLLGQAALPLALGTVGGATGAHPGVQAAFRVIQVGGARELAVVLASVGLASNLAALRALATEGIQKGHMKLHHRKFSPPEGHTP